MNYFEQKAGNFGPAMAVPAVPLPTTLIYAWSIRMLDRRLKATFHLTISMSGERATGKIQRNNYHNITGAAGPL